jgi:hypothetical protein
MAHQETRGRCLLHPAPICIRMLIRPPTNTTWTTLTPYSTFLSYTYRSPGLDDEYGLEAAQTLASLVGGGKKVKAVVERRERASSAAFGAGDKKAVWGGGNIARSAASGPDRLLLTVFLSADEEESAEDTANARMLDEGMARIAEPARGTPPLSAPASALLAVLRESESRARRAHVGMWEFGDPGSEDEN